MRKSAFLIFLLVAMNVVHAQELNARVTINSNSVGSTVNKGVFQTLQIAITNLLNNRSWTPDAYLPNEKIDCSFLLNLQPTADADVYTASLIVQAGRPIYNSSYLSPLINWQDKDIKFKYVQYQQLEFNESNIAGVDPLVSNLAAIIAYYADMVLAFEYDSFSPRAGDVYFQKAQNIVNGAPESSGIAGWQAFDGTRNRYWLAENMLNSRYTVIHDIYYGYYRKSMDKMYEAPVVGRTEMMKVLTLLDQFNTDNPNTMIEQFFFQGKTTEIIKIFSKASQQDKARASGILQKLDITNAARYKDELQ